MSLRTDPFFQTLLAFFVLLGSLYATLNPLLESPDELLNYRNMREIVETGRLPVLEPDEFSKAHHPPLYYLIGAAATAPIPNHNLATLGEAINPFFGYRTYAPGIDNKSQYLHGSELAAWPWRDAALGLHLMRYLSVLLGAVGVWAIVHITHALFDSRWLALGAGALVAFNPMYVYIQSAVHNDALTNPLAALTILACVRYWQSATTRRQVALIGLVAGLGIMTKITFLFLGPLVALLIIARHVTRRGSGAQWVRQLVTHLLIGGGVVVLIAGWWFVRNQLLYGEPTSMELQASIWQPRPNTPDWGAAIGELDYLRDSFWGAFGFGQILFPRPVYFGLQILLLIATLGVVARLLRQDSLTRDNATLLLILTLAPLAAFGATFSRMAVSATANFGRYLFTGYGTLAPLLIWGLSAWFPAGRQRWLSWGLSGLLIGLSFYALLGVILPAYTPPPRLVTADAAAIENPLDLTFDGELELLGYALSGRSIEPYEPLMLTLYWRASAPIEQNYIEFVQLVEADGSRFWGRDTLHGLGRYPTRRWTPGEIVVDEIPLHLPAYESQLARGLRLDVGLVGGDGTLAETAVGVPVVNLGPVRLAPTRPIAPAPARYRLGDLVNLVGLEAPSDALRGAPFALTLRWEALSAPPRDYSRLLHLLDSNGNLVATFDGPPGGAVFPTSLWRPGDVVADAQPIGLPEGLADGRYTLVSGWYTLDDFTRLAAFTPNDERLPNDQIPLLDITVEGDSVGLRPSPP